MSTIKLYIYGNKEDYIDSLKFLPENDHIIYIKSIKEFLEQSKNHDSLQISGILRAGLAVEEGFLEYYSATAIKDDEIIFAKTKKALDAPINGQFKKYIDDSSNIYDFILSYSHLLTELLDDGWNNFENYIQNLELSKYIDDQMYVFKIDRHLIKIHEERCSVFNEINKISNDIMFIQKQGISPEIKSSILAKQKSADRIDRNNIHRIENAPEHENPLPEDMNTQEKIRISQHLNNEAREQNIKKRLSKNNSDYMEYILSQYK